MTIYDYIVIGFYLTFMFLLGPIYKSFSKTSSDFFRGGGGMLWWVVGSSAFMTTFTAWAFTGGAAKAYETGTFFLVIFGCNILSLIFCFLFVVAKYRQMRIITVMEGVRKRFGKTSEQMLSWLLVVVKILYGGAMLYAIAIFMSSVFNVPMPIMIIGLGMIITLMTVFGGSWSATAGDFVQMIVVVIITVVMSALTLVKVGGEYDLSLMSVNDVSAIPEEGESLVIIGKYEAGDILHLRIFDAGGIEVVDKTETNFTDKNAEIQQLKEALVEYWDQSPIPPEKKEVILESVTSITGHTIGGIGAFIDAIPAHHRDWTLFDRTGVLVIFIITLFINQCIQMNSLLEGAARFIFVKDARSAKKAVLIQMAGLILLPLIWIVPPMMAAVWFPNMKAMFPNLNNPNEAAYVAMAMKLLPAGLFGMLVCGIFAATVTSLNSQLNLVGGNFVRNIYIQVVRPRASEKEQIAVGRVFIFIYGVIWILLGLGFQLVEGLELFDLLLLIAAATTLPLTVPLFLGIFFKKTPPWAGWSTMVAGFVPAAILTLLFKVEWFVQWLWQDPKMTSAEVVRMIWQTADLNKREIGDLKLAITTGVVAAVSVGWFFLTMLFYRKDEKSYVDQVDTFFKDMATPVQSDEHELGGHDNETRQYSVLGNLCLVYGAFILLLIFIPNKPSGRLIIFFCGAIISGAGLILKVLSKRSREKTAGTLKTTG